VLEEASATERPALMQEFIASQVREVMGQSGPQDVPGEKPLMELGMDSLMAVELRNRLARAIEAELPATLLFDHPTVAVLSAFLARTAFSELFPPAPALDAGNGERARLAKEVAAMSEEDMEALIAAEFSRLKPS
jgi:acyl carrier protein